MSYWISFQMIFKVRPADFTQGHTPPNPNLTIQKVARDQSEVDRRTLGASDFADALLAYRRPFQGEPKVKLRLMSLLPVDRNQLDSAWYGNLQLRMLGQTPTSSIREIVFVVDFVFNQIADPDLIVLTKGWIDSLRIKEGQIASTPQPLMEEVAESMGIDPSLFLDNWNIPVEERGIGNGGVYLADVNRDGIDDVLINDFNGLFLFHGLPEGGFKEVTQDYSLPRGYRGAANVAFADFDNDGWVDLVVDSVILRNQEGKSFVNVSNQTTLRLDDRKAAVVSGYAVGDYDKDGFVDLYVSRSHGPGRSKKDSWIDGPGGPGNQLWRNLGNWRFENVSSSANAKAGRRSAFTSAFLDANNDSWPDIYVINEFGGGILLVNQKNGRFEERPLIADAGDFGSMGMTVGDMDNDGNIDVYTANMYSKAGRRIMENLPEGTYPKEIFDKIKRFVTGSELYQNRGDLEFERVAKGHGINDVGWAYGPLLVDLDNNGFLDIYANAGFFSVDSEDPDG